MIVAQYKISVVCAKYLTYIPGFFVHPHIQKQQIRPIISPKLGFKLPRKHLYFLHMTAKRNDNYAAGRTFRPNNPPLSDVQNFNKTHSENKQKYSTKYKVHMYLLL